MDQSTSGEGSGGGVYAAALRPLLFRLDPERAHELSLALLSRVAPAMARLPGPPDGEGRLEQQLFGPALPQPHRAGGRLRQARAGGAGVAGARASASPRSARSPRTASRATPGRASTGCPRTGRSSTGSGSTTTAPWRTARGWPRWQRRGLLRRAPLGVNIGRSKVAPPERRGRRLRGHPRAAVALRGLRRDQRQLAQHARSARPPGDRPARRDPGRRGRRSTRAWPAPAARRARGRCW